MPNLSLMIKPSSGKCNMNCQYCFYHDVIEHREEKDKSFMSEETAKTLIIKSLEFADGAEIYYAFQGGEPLLRGIDFYNFFVKTVKENNYKGSRVTYNIQTNGTLINDEWATFFKDNDFLVGLSLDGNIKTNKYRVYGNRKESYHDILKAYKILLDKKVDVNILIVLTDLVAKNIKEVYEDLKNIGVRYMQFIPCLNSFEKAEEKYLTDEVMRKFLLDCFTLYTRDFVNNDYVSIRQFDNWVRMYMNEPPEQCGLLGYCYMQFVSEANGDIYPCDFFCTDDYLLGNIKDKDFSELFATQKHKDFISSSLAIKDECLKCSYYNICRQGGCKRLRLSDDYCEVYKEFFEKAQKSFELIKMVI